LRQHLRAAAAVTRQQSRAQILAVLVVVLEITTALLQVALLETLHQLRHLKAITAGQIAQTKTNAEAVVVQVQLVEMEALLEVLVAMEALVLHLQFQVHQ